MPKYVPDEEIMNRMGLSDTEVRDVEAKFAVLAGSLDEAQRETLKKTIPTADAAAQTLGTDVTADRLMEFIRSRAPHDAAMVICFNGSGHHHK